ncbi:MAG: hypothetical protein KF811_04285 [Dokdonella sp.]|nr:hypothetical protein [Dokdonella sp.]
MRDSDADRIVDAIEDIRQTIHTQRASGDPQLWRNADFLEHEVLPARLEQLRTAQTPPSPQPEHPKSLAIDDELASLLAGIDHPREVIGAGSTAPVAEPCQSEQVTLRPKAATVPPHPLPCLIPDEVIRSAEWDRLAPNTRKLLRVLAGLRANNGDVSAAVSVIRCSGWENRSKRALTDAIREAIETGFLFITRESNRRRCRLYALTWAPLSKTSAHKFDTNTSGYRVGMWKRGTAVEPAAPPITRAA